MQGLKAAAVAVVLCSAFGVKAYTSRDVKPVCDVTFAAAQVHTDGNEGDVFRQLQEKDRELVRLRAELEARTEASLYAEAQAQGIVDAVKRSMLPPKQQRRVAIAIVREAKANNLDPLLVVAVIRTESSFNNYAVSHVGAMGLMQVMPATGTWLMQRKGEKIGRTSNLFDPELNIQLGTGYLAELIQMFGTREKALVAYNAGPGGARKILKGKNAKKFIAGYPTKVLGEYRKLRREADTRMAGQGEAPVPNGRG